MAGGDAAGIESVIMNELLEPYLITRAMRLLEANEPELCAAIRAAVETGATAEEVRLMVLRTIGRRDTSLMAYYFALGLAE